MLDFTSALYLGFQHPSSSLPAWSQLSLGKPAALEEPERMGEVEGGLAELMGCAKALVGSSTLHLFWDVFGWVAKAAVEAAGPPIEMFVDGGTYPIARWALSRAVVAGVPIHYVHEHDVDALRRAMRGRGISRPVIVTDGFCPACDRWAPLRKYVEVAEANKGWVIIDDSQALGLFGKSGGGSLRMMGLSGSRAIVVSSLAKAFGVPLAVLAGGSAEVDEIRDQSDTRVHCSPPSVPVIAAAAVALRMNWEAGDLLRRRLASRVVRFRKGLRSLGLVWNRSLFPMQRLHLPRGCGAKRLYEQLLERGVRTVLHRAGRDGHAQISFIITAQHSCEDIDKAIYALLSATGESHGKAHLFSAPNGESFYRTVRFG